MRAWAVLGALSLGLSLGGALAQQGSKDRGWEVRSFGTFTLPLELQGQTKRATVLGATVFGSGLRQVPQVVSAPSGWPPSLRNQYLTLVSGSLSPGQVADVRIDYTPYPDSSLVPVLIRGWASNGNMFNTGTLVVTDDPDAPTDPNLNSQYRYHFKVTASGGLSVWKILLGLALWLTPGGQIGTILLLTRDPGAGQATFMLARGTTTLYYRYTGCTAFDDYKGRFTVDTSNVPAGQAIVLNAQGWCGGGGVGNWARISQAAATPSDFHNWRNDFQVSFLHPVLRTPALRFTFLYSDIWVRGPDDCGGYYTDPYDRNEGISYVISGADCARNMWGAPGKPSRSYTSYPSLTLGRSAMRAILLEVGNEGASYTGYLSNGTYHLYDVSNYPRLPATNVSELGLNYTPSPYVPGSLWANQRTVTTTTPDGRTVTTTVTDYTFSPSYGQEGMALVGGLGPSFPLPTITIPQRSATCPLTNRGTETIRAHFLDVPGTYTPGTYSNAITYTISPNQTVNVPKPGFYVVEPNRDPYRLPYGLQVGCGVINTARVGQEANYYGSNIFYLF